MAGSFRWHRAVNRTRGGVVASRVEVADTPFSRLKGLLGRAGLEEEQGLWIVPCGSIHTWFMRFPIDAAFVDAAGRVVRVASNLGPFRAAFGPGARAVLELKAGRLEGRVQEGDDLALEPVTAEQEYVP